MNRISNRRAILLVLALGLTIGHPRQTLGEDQLPPFLLEDERNTIEIFREQSDAVVFIRNSELRRQMFSRNVMEVPRGSGSGFVWDNRGYIVTNYHVIQGGDQMSVTLSDGTEHDARIVGGDANKDLAVLKIEVDNPGRLTAVRLGDSKDLLVGQKVLAIGNPFGLDQTLTTGVISALGREIRSVANTTISDVVQTDASINPGNSGGPLLDSRGYLIGVNTAIYSTSGSSVGIGFAVPVSTVKRIVPQLIEFGKATRAGLGVSLLGDDLARRWGIQGVIIQEVQRGSAADRAGLQGSTQDRRGRVRVGDVIIGINNSSVTNYDDLYTALDKHRPGDKVTIRYVRDDREKEVMIKLQQIG